MGCEFGMETFGEFWTFGHFGPSCNDCDNKLKNTEYLMILSVRHNKTELYIYAFQAIGPN